jgi:hypothetical protein
MPLPSAGEHGAGASAGGDNAIRYKGGPMTDEHDRSAIRAIIQAALPKHLTKSRIAIAAGITSVNRQFKRKFEKYEGKAGGWKCTEGGGLKPKERAGVTAM